jgi:hypothetical protein
MKISSLQASRAEQADAQTETENCDESGLEHGTPPLERSNLARMTHRVSRMEALLACNCT